MHHCFANDEPCTTSSHTLVYVRVYITLWRLMKMKSICILTNIWKLHVLVFRLKWRGRYGRYGNEIFVRNFLTSIVTCYLLYKLFTNFVALYCNCFNLTDEKEELFKCCFRSLLLWKKRIQNMYIYWNSHAHLFFLYTYQCLVNINGKNIYQKKVSDKNIYWEISGG